jgi:hypothetical protein
MTREDLVILAVLALVIFLLAHSSFQYVQAAAVETQLTAEWNLLKDEEKTAANCLGQPGCESATWKLTLETKQSETSRAWITVRHDKSKSMWEGGLTILGFLFILIFYPELRAALFARFRRGRPQTQSQLRPGIE